MSKKITKNKAAAVVAAPVVKKIKAPSFKLISYTLKAVIPTGQYANIQPEITVQAKTLEAAERAVMPYIETLFAKYRDGGVQPILATRGMTTTQPVAPTPAQAPKPAAPTVGVDMAKPGSEKTVETTVDTKTGTVSVAPAIVLTVPFNRAKGAIDSCMSLEALKLVSDQVEKSTKLIDTEKAELRKVAAAKLETLNGPKKV